MAKKVVKNPGRWVSPMSLLVCTSVFVASVFCFYVSAASDVFYRADVVALEFLAAIFSGAGVGFIIYRSVFPAEKLNRK